MSNGSQENEPSSIIQSARHINLEYGKRNYNETEVTLYLIDENGNSKNLNNLILPKGEHSWVIIQGDGNILIGCDSMKRQVRIPEYVISIDGTFDHDYEAVKGSRTDLGEYPGIESHEFLKLNGAGYTLLHEVGHAWKDNEIRDDLEIAYTVRDMPVDKWDYSDYLIYRNIVIPMEEEAWNKADLLDEELRNQGINLELNWDTDKKRRHREYALSTYYERLREYERINNLTIDSLH